MAIVEARRAFPEAHLTVVIDNAAAYHSLENGFTSSRGGSRIMSEVLKDHAADCFLHVVSEDNPRDCHSRGKYDDLQEQIHRLTDTWEAVEGARGAAAPTSRRHNRGQCGQPSTRATRRSRGLSQRTRATPRG